jgi:hypothetical protein
MSKRGKPRLIPLYLPQYHPIPENDAWWGKGFTEWRNVAKAKPLFKGHYQPHHPGDLGFYDLRVPEVREAQAQMAKEAGIEGFCYWYLWYAGKRLLERPFNEVLESGKPDFPFCLGWDNETWTGIWHNAPDRILIEQTYPGYEDNVAHFNNVLLPAFTDNRYITVDDKPLLIIFRPADIPLGMPDHFRSLAISAGFKGIYIVGIVWNDEEGRIILNNGFDGYTSSRTSGRAPLRNPFKNFLIRILGEKKASSFYHQILKKPFYVYNYSDTVPYLRFNFSDDFEYYPCVMPNWDNSPRSGFNAHIWTDSTPELFKERLIKAIKRVENYSDEHKIIIIKSWNEWAEGNYLEPDLKHGMGYLNAIREVMEHL